MPFRLQLMKLSLLALEERIIGDKTSFMLLKTKGIYGKIRSGLQGLEMRGLPYITHRTVSDIIM